MKGWGKETAGNLISEEIQSVCVKHPWNIFWPTVAMWYSTARLLKQPGTF